MPIVLPMVIAHGIIGTMVRPDEWDQVPNKELRRALGLFSCTMLVVGNMIGVGIFTTPGRIATLLPSSGLVFLAWILGAVLAISGALSYAELGAAYPEAGGNYIFLRESFGLLWSFLYGWSAVLITQSGTIAILAVGFTKYAGITSPVTVQACAIGLILFFGALNYLGVKVGAGVVDFITLLKILAIVGFALAAALFGHGQWSNALPLWVPGSGLGSLSPQSSALSVVPAMAMALIPIMYTYSGWNATVYVGSEVLRPSRTIPLSLILGVVLTGALYLLLNAVYVYAMPVPQMRGVIAIAKEAAGAMFSPQVAGGISFFIAFSVLGCLNATLLTAPRISFAMAQRGQFFEPFGRVHPRFQTPHLSIVLQMVWASGLAFWGGIDHKNFYRLLDDYVTVPSLLLNALTVAALFYLRKRKPDLPRPYKVWGYPWVPLGFILSVLWMIASAVRQDALAALAGVAMVAVGSPFYLYFRNLRHPPQSLAGEPSGRHPGEGRGLS
jgi:basic amino acid/polyamine antiporter, APA family